MIGFIKQMPLPQRSSKAPPIPPSSINDKLSSLKQKVEAQRLSSAKTQSGSERDPNSESINTDKILAKQTDSNITSVRTTNSASKLSNRNAQSAKQSDEGTQSILEAFMNSLSLQRYLPALSANAIDSIDILAAATNAELEEVGMLMPHIKRLRDGLQRWAKKQADQKAAAKLKEKQLLQAKSKTVVANSNTDSDGCFQIQTGLAKESGMKRAYFCLYCYKKCSEMKDRFCNEACDTAYQFLFVSQERALEEAETKFSAKDNADLNSGSSGNINDNEAWTKQWILSLGVGEQPLELKKLSDDFDYKQYEETKQWLKVLRGNQKP